MGLANTINSLHPGFERENILVKTSPVMDYYSKVSIIWLAYLCCISYITTWGKPGFYYTTHDVRS